MSTPHNEFSHLDRSVKNPRGETFHIVCHVGYSYSRLLPWGRRRTSHVPIVTVFRDDEIVVQEDAADLKDAQRMISRLEHEITRGTHPFGQA